MCVMHGTGLELENMNQAQVGIASVDKVKKGVKKAGLIGYRFNTVGMMGGQWYDANISIPGCDKNMPGCLIAMGRLNRPSLMVYGGTIRAGIFKKTLKHACPGPGACGGMYTANTMASAIEALERLNAGQAIRNLLEQDMKLDDFQKISDSTPDLKPRFDLYKKGGIPAVLLENNLIHGDTLIVTGKTLSENLSNAPPLSFETQNLIHPLSNPIKPTGHIQILYGNLAPEGSMTKITGKEGLTFSGIAKVFDTLEQDEIKKGQVIVIRYEVPKGGPGMPEMYVVLLTDGRFSGGSHGFIIGNITPKAQVGGPIALVKDGDRITIDAEKKSIHLDITDDEFLERQQRWSAPPYRATNGTLYKYIKNVKSASEGCVTDE
ncbi:19716_t:CDS:10 [Gigaspora margarita]|uniref:19716_t:CDS:1 n=1 Tax=Gigaspora margarita TaxID=4874 RepID=A0ABN7UIJ4_GIGMA|nr:19716_t:CDS:10 [Gigaspora margarita]